MAARKTKWQNDYTAKTYERVDLTLLKGQKDVVQSYTSAQGESVNSFIGRAIAETMEQSIKGENENEGA